MNTGLGITKKQLVTQIKKLGLGRGQTIMLHASVKSIGNIIGGPKTIINAILEILTQDGTLMMLVAWENSPYNIFNTSFQEDIDKWPEHKRQKCPSFNQKSSKADTKKMGILSECLRTYPGSVRSRHPLGYAAVGKLAQDILKDQQWQYREGLGSPLEKLCNAGGYVLLLGAPTETVTLLHFSENIANIQNKKIIHYKMPIIQNGKRVWKEIEEYDFVNGIVPWPDDYFKSIVDEYIQENNGLQGIVGFADSYLFDANDLNNFAVNWMESHFRYLEDR